MLKEFLMLAVKGSELMFPISLLIVALGFAGLVILILVAKGRAD
ncbi:MAG: hypothetical protein QXW32_02775 [Nitrososphaerales archaeon]